MKKIVTLLLTLVAFTTLNISAQPMGGGMGGGMLGGEAPEIDPLSMMGLFEIDERDVVKGVKVKDPELQRAICRAVGEYIMAYGDVISTHNDAVMQMEMLKEEIAQQQINSDMVGMRTSMNSVIEYGKQIRPYMVEAHHKLDDTMKQILSADPKATNKWKVYHESICEDHMFMLNMPDRGARGGQRGQGGQGGRPGPGGQRPTRE